MVTLKERILKLLGLDIQLQAPQPEQQLRKQFKEARELLNFAISEGHQVDDKIIGDINKIEVALRDPNSAVNFGERAEFEKSYRDLARSLDPVTPGSLRVSILTKCFAYISSPAFLVLLLIARYFWFPEVSIVIPFILAFGYVLIVFFVDLFTGVIPKDQIIKMVLFCYLFTIGGILLTGLPFLLSFIIKWEPGPAYCSMQRSPIGVVKACNAQLEPEWVSKELRCKSDDGEFPQYAQWVINIAGTIEAPCSSFSSPVGSIESDVDVGAKIIRLNAAAATVLAEQDWIGIEGNTGQERTETEVVRVTGPIEAGKDVVISPALRFAHAAGRKVHRATNPVTAQEPVVIRGGLVIPLYVVFLSLIGALVSMTRRVPWFQRRTSLPPGSKEHISRSLARELLIGQIMQVFSAPLIAITAYYILKPDTLTMSVTLGFASGFSSEIILRSIGQLVENLRPDDKPEPPVVKEPAPSVSAVQPNRWTAGKPGLTLTLVGTGFKDEAVVFLAQGDTKLIPEDIKVIQSTKITCRFGLVQAGPKPKWDVVVTNPDKQTGTLTAGLEIST